MTADSSTQAAHRKDANGNDGLGRLLDHVANLAPVRAAMVHPCDALSLAAALDVRDAGRRTGAGSPVRGSRPPPRAA